MAFQGWPVEALEFYEGLEVDNTKAYWAEHKKVYEDRVRAPMGWLDTHVGDSELESAWGH